jgi:hypothetical protein
MVPTCRETSFTLRVQPSLGRGFLDSEDQAVGRDAVVVLGHDFWVSEFNASPAVIGSTMRLNGVECRIIGVGPEGFTASTHDQTRPVRSHGNVFRACRVDNPWRSAICDG